MAIFHGLFYKANTTTFQRATCKVHLAIKDTFLFWYSWLVVVPEILQVPWYHNTWGGNTIVQEYRDNESKIHTFASVRTSPDGSVLPNDGCLVTVGSSHIGVSQNAVDVSVPAHCYFLFTFLRSISFDLKLTVSNKFDLSIRVFTWKRGVSKRRN